MKRFLLCGAIFLAIIGVADAQTKNKKADAKTQTTIKNTNTKKKTIIQQESISANAAKIPAIPRSTVGWRNIPVTGTHHKIADPVVQALNERANGATTIEFKE